MSVTDSAKLAKAIREAERFIEAASKVQESGYRQIGAHITHSNASPKDTGATRRASMDLTRALAELRSYK